MYNKKWTNYRTANKGNNVFYNYLDDIDTAGDKTRDAYNKGIEEGTKKAEQLAIPEDKKDKYVENYAKAELSADNDMELYNNAAINMAKIEAEAKNPDPVTQKETEKLATMESKDIPMSEYIEAKDQNDHKKGTYTTTKYASPFYKQNVKNIQHTLNEKGVTDKFSEHLEEDGLWGAQTYSALRKAFESDDVDEETKSAIEKVLSVGKSALELNKDIKDSIPIDFVDKDSYAQKTFLQKTAEKARGQTHKKYRLETNIRDNNNNKNILTLVNTEYGEGKNVSKRILKVEYKNNTDQYHYSIDKNNIDMKDRKKLAKSLNLTDVETEELLSSKKGLMHVYKPKEEGDKIVDFLKNGKKASKILGVVGDSFSIVDKAVDIGKAVYHGGKMFLDFIDDRKVEKETFSETADYIATEAASYAGSAVGAKIGAAIGTAAFGIVGTVVGGFIGSVVGNAIGAVVGGKAADMATEAIYD